MEQSEEDVTTDAALSLESNNSFGNYIAQQADRKQLKDYAESLNQSDRFSIFSAEFDPVTGCAKVVSTQATSCNLHLKVIDENGNVISETQERVQAGTDIITELKLNYLVLPDYYKISAELIGEDSAPLCQP